MKELIITDDDLRNINPVEGNEDVMPQSENEDIIMRCYKNGHKKVYRGWLVDKIGMASTSADLSLKRLRGKGVLIDKWEILRGEDGVRRKCRVYYKKDGEKIGTKRRKSKSR